MANLTVKDTAMELGVPLCVPLGQHWAGKRSKVRIQPNDRALLPYSERQVFYEIVMLLK